MTLREQFFLDPHVAFLNHGSFGACPRPVLEEYQRCQRELERQPVEFLARRYAVELPPGDPDAFQRRLREEHAIEVPCFEHHGRALLRISVQGYNSEEDIERLAAAL